MAPPAAAGALSPGDGDTASPPSVVVRPFRVSPPPAAAADTAAVSRLYVDAMQSVRASIPPFEGMDDDARAVVTAVVDAWLTDIVDNDLQDIPTAYALPLTEAEADAPPVDAAAEAADVGGATAEAAAGGAATAGGTADGGAAATPPVRSRGYFFVAEDAATGVALGCAGLKPPAIPPPTRGARADAPLSMELVRMAVAPTARGRGAGRALVAAATAAAVDAGVRRLHLSTSSVMGPALALYASDGWVETGRVGLGDMMGSELAGVPIDTVFMDEVVGGGTGAGGP